MPLSREQQDALFGRGTISARRPTPSQATSPVAAPRDEPRGGFSGFVGAIGERVPQGVKDAASAAGRGFQFLDEPISNRLGIDAPGPLDFILEEISRPTNIALALGTALTGGLGAGGFAARSAARAGGRVAARDIGGALGARTAIGGVNRVLPEDASAGLRIPLSIAGALTGAGVGASLAGTLRSVKTAEREAARAAVAMRFGEHGDLVNKFSTRIDEVKPSLVTREASTAQTRAITGEELKHAFSSGPMNEDAAKAVAGIRTGAIDDIGFESVAADFTSADMTHLFTMVKDSTRLNDFAKKRVITMMVDMFSPEGFTLPNRALIRDAEKVFGPGVSAALEQRRTLGQELWDVALDAINVPRAIQSSWDVSAPFRQGAVLVGRKEFWQSWKPMFRAMKSKDFSDERALFREVDPDSVKAVREGLENTVIGGGRHAEEAFRSRWSQNIPGVAASERGFTTFMNELRFNTHINTSRRWAEQGVGSSSERRQLAEWLNTATGRTKLPNNQVIEVMKNTMFAPRLWLSRLLTPVAWIGKSRQVQREMARDLGVFVAAGLGALAMLKLTFGAEIQTDPRSSNFGKGKIGNIRIDPWAGFQPVARYIAQLYSGQAKTAAGEIIPRDRTDTAGRFIRSKLAPMPGLLTDLYTGATFLGEESGFTTSGPQGQVTSEAVQERFVPFFVQDLVGAFEHEGLTGVLLGLPAGVGIGVGAYTTLNDVRNNAGESVYQKPWDELDGIQQAQLKEQFADEFAGAKSRTAFSNAKDVIEEDIWSRERELSEGLKLGADPRAVNEELSELNLIRITKLNQLFVDSGFDSGASRPVDEVFAQRENARRGGVLDFELLDQLTEDALAALPPDDQRRYEQRARFLHDPSVIEFFDAKGYLRDNGYWDIQREEFERVENSLRRIAPEITTTMALEMAIRVAERERDRGRLRQLGRFKTMIGKRTERRRNGMRRSDPSIDAALVRVYGATPIRSRR